MGVGGGGGGPWVPWVGHGASGAPLSIVCTDLSTNGVLIVARGGCLRCRLTPHGAAWAYGACPHLRAFISPATTIATPASPLLQSFTSFLICLSSIFCRKLIFLHCDIQGRKKSCAHGRRSRKRRPDRWHEASTSGLRAFPSHYVFVCVCLCVCVCVCVFLCVCVTVRVLVCTYVPKIRILRAGLARYAAASIDACH